MDGSNAALEAVGACPRQQIRRPVKALSFEVAHHVKAYLDHKHYEQAYIFLHSLLAAGSSISVPAKPYVGLLAPAAHLALASTLVVYPPTSTRATSADARQGSDAALRYLRCVHDTIRGPGYKTVKDAFSFTHTRRRGVASAAANHVERLDVERLDTLAANAHSLWQRAEDFWHVIGWAFNCAAIHKLRWERWRLWLDVTLDFLEADWDDCAKYGAQEPTERDAMLQDTLIWRYISSQDPAISNTRRRIIKAIFAVGDAQSLQQYPEVWDKETMEAKPPDAKSETIGLVDFENENDGDYMSDDEDTVMINAPRRAAGGRSSKNPLSASMPSLEDAFTGDYNAAVQKLGGIDAVDLRQRFVALLMKVAKDLPAHFTSPEGLLDTLTQQVRYFSTPVLSVLITTSRLSPHHQLAFNVNLTIPLTSKRYPEYTTEAPTQSDLETLLLPCRARTQSYVANAKLSLLQEQVFLYMMGEELIEATSSLRQAMETGIEERHKVHGIGGIKANLEEEEHGKTLMAASSGRLLSLLEVLEMSAGKPPRPRKEKNKSEPLLSSFGSSLSPAPESETDDDD
ncbi:hypothetical protein N0V90_007281 [Kalmusia sp. IMI 367209]|nr:hypothetical protein N0V90_007281 [Kalmusia sp. IMI 367209]